MTVLEAAESVLLQAAGPLPIAELTRRMLERRLWISHGKTPEATVQSRLSRDVKSHGRASRFRRTAPATYGLAVYGDGAGSAAVDAPHHTVSKPLSFLDAAERVLWDVAQVKPMHYRQITQIALEKGWLASSGLTPEATMGAQLYADIDRRASRGQPVRFARLGPGMFGMAAWQPIGLAGDIAAHNERVKADLLGLIRGTAPTAFEELVATLLTALGFVDVQVTSPWKDGGIDVRGTLVVGEVIRTRMAVQVKRWKANVRAPVVQQLRGSLGAQDQALIITTSDFSTGAQAEARRANAIPVALMNGSQLVDLLVEHEINVRRVRHELIELTFASSARQPKIPLRGPFIEPEEPCAGQWSLHSAYGEWWCWAPDYSEVLDRVVNQPYLDMLKEASRVTTREECRRRFPDLFWYGGNEVGPPGTCRGHQ